MTAESLGLHLPLERTTKSVRLDLRLSPQQKRLLEDAAAITDRTLTDFVLQSASMAARQVIADRTTFALTRERWDAFSAELDREPRYLSDLAAFLAKPSALDRK